MQLPATSFIRTDKKIEILVNFNPKLHYVSEWWKQLYGESEGKENKGIFPAAVDFSTDLHSMGQWIQEGERTILRNCHFRGEDQPLTASSFGRSQPGRTELPGRQARGRSEQDG